MSENTCFLRWCQNAWKSVKIVFFGTPGIWWISLIFLLIVISMGFYDFFWMIEWFFFLLNEFFCFHLILIEEFFLNEWVCWCGVRVDWVDEWCIELNEKIVYIYIDIYIYMWFFVTHPRMCHIVWYCVWICVYLCVFVSNCVNLCHIVSFCVVFCVYLCVFVCILCVFVCICVVVSICTYLRVPNWGTVPRPEWAIY